MSKTLTIKNGRGEPVMVIDRMEWERTELEAQRRHLLQELRRIRREKRQLRDVHSMESG
jgi:PHD/YefM family antitoxin component YafN of YafNO toxin-antitoxin module